MAVMYVTRVPNRASPPAVLLRESYREGGKVKNRTLANLSSWPEAKVEALSRALKGLPPAGLEGAFEITRSLPHGHVAAVLGTIRELGLEELIAPVGSRQRDLVTAMITAAVIDGRTCPLGLIGHARDGVRGRLQIVYGVLTTSAGIPVAVQVFKGNTGDPATLADQVTKLRQRFGLTHVAIAGDRGMITKARIKDDLRPAELDWVTALRGPAIAALMAGGAIQPSLSGETDMAEITPPDYPGERLIACYNPFLAAERVRKPASLLAATEAELEKIDAATRRARRPLRGQDTIALAVGKVINKKKVAKHFITAIADDGLAWRRDEQKIAAEAALDGIYVIR